MELISLLDPTMAALRAAPPQTFAEEAAQAIRDFHNRLDADPDARENYIIMFLADYSRALYWKHTDRHCFLDAYAHRELAIMNGAIESELDLLAYDIRQKWAKDTRPGVNR